MYGLLLRGNGHPANEQNVGHRKSTTQRDDGLVAVLVLRLMDAAKRVLVVLQEMND